jgi:mRNA interferase RelE/StbE
MKRYTIQYSPPAYKELETLSAEVQDRVVAAINALEENPRPQGSKKLKGSKDKYRIRVGRYGVIYEIHEKEIIVLIVRISHRKDAYR